MQLDIFCTNCKEHVLQADTDTLTSPLVGHMFTIKRDMEWSMFSPHDIEINLTCPLCEWLIHEDGKIRVVFNGDILFDMPDKVVDTILARVGGVRKPVEPLMTTEEINQEKINQMLNDAEVQGTVEPHKLETGGSSPPSATTGPPETEKEELTPAAAVIKSQEETAANEPSKFIGLPEGVTIDPVKAKLAEKKETFTEKIKKKIKKRKRGRPKKKTVLQKMGLE